MKKLWFIFHESEVLLQNTGHGFWSIPSGEESPLEPMASEVITPGDSLFSM